MRVKRRKEIITHSTVNTQIYIYHADKHLLSSYFPYIICHCTHWLSPISVTLHEGKRSLKLISWCGVPRWQSPCQVWKKAICECLFCLEITAVRLFPLRNNPFRIHQTSMSYQHNQICIQILWVLYPWMNVKVTETGINLETLKVSTIISRLTVIILRHSNTSQHQLIFFFQKVT